MQSVLTGYHNVHATVTEDVAHHVDKCTSLEPGACGSLRAEELHIALGSRAASGRFPRSRHRSSKAGMSDNRQGSTCGAMRAPIAVEIGQLQREKASEKNVMPKGIHSSIHSAH